MDISPADWQTLSTLAEEVELPPDRVSALRRRIESAESADGRPFLLLVGQRGAGLERLLEDWVGEKAVETLEKAADRPLIIGISAAEVQPSFGKWPILEQAIPGCDAAHLIVLRTDGAKLAADIKTGLGALGCIDELILVTRLGQPLTQTERELAANFPSLAATARALVVGLPGEAPGSSEIAKVSAYASAHLRQVGFVDGRCLGAGVWFSDKDGGDAQTGAIEDVGQWIQIDRSELENGREQVLRKAVGSLLGEISRRASEFPEQVKGPIDEEERERLSKELEEHLRAVGQQATRWVETRPVNNLSEGALESYLLDTLRGWGAYIGAEGVWLRYVERLRPGIQASLLAEAAEAIHVLNLEIPEAKSLELSSSPKPPVTDPKPPGKARHSPR